MPQPPWNLLEQLTPFHAAWDLDGGLVHVSEPLRKLWKTKSPLAKLQKELQLLRPFAGIIQSSWLPDLTNLNLQVTHQGQPERVIRGQVIRHDDFWILVGAPNVHSVAELTKMGLKLSDLPIHDGTGDLLISVETSRVAHRETQARSEQLAAAIGELRTVNLALSGFVPSGVLNSLGLDNASLDDVGTRAEAVGRFIEHLQHTIEFRESFMANMSHELRTPLNAIMGITEVLSEGIYGPLSDKQIEMLKTVHDSGDHLLSLINDLLDLSKIESGGATLRLGDHKVNALCESALQLVGQQAQSKGIELIYHNESRAESISVDRRRIRQVLLNLLSNAIKFTDEGHVALRVDDLASESAIRIHIEDTGIGISDDDQPKLFQPFFQVEHGLTRKYAGTGLGLAISRRAVELHGGRIELLSTPEQGSCFTVVLPTEAKQSDISDDLLGEAFQSTEQLKRSGGAIPKLQMGPEDVPPYILIVDDIVDNRTYLVDCLQHSGFTVDEADNGISALESIADRLPDLLLLDVQMPGFSGLDVLRCLRAMPTTESLPVILLTGSAMKLDRERGRKAGANAFIAKPCNISELMKEIGTLLHLESIITEEDREL